MSEKSKYFHFDESAESLVLNDRLEIQWKEIFLYPIPLAVFMFFLSGSNILIAVSFGVVFVLISIHGL